MSEMVQRVVLAISGGDEVASVLAIHRDRARAAIAAMREPTEAMINASNREWDGRMSHRSSGAWQAMIDEALK